MKHFKRLFPLIVSLFIALLILCPYAYASNPKSYLESKWSTVAGGGASVDIYDRFKGMVSGSKADADLTEIQNKVAQDLERSLATYNGETMNASKRISALNKSLESLYALIWKIIDYLVTFGIITSVLVLMFNFVKLATIPNHPMQRRQCYESIVVGFITTMLTGGVKLILTIFYSTFSSSVTSGLMYAGSWEIPFVAFLNQYKDLIIGFSGVAALTMFLLLGKSFLDLVISGGNPAKRQQAMTAILLTVVATAGVGSVMMIAGWLSGVFSL